MLKRMKKKKNFTALVESSLIDQAAAFTAPRGRCEMGGLLLGHVDKDGNNVAVCGFFPEQTEAHGGYCEFDGSFNAVAAAACEYANEETKKDNIPEVRIIGWIHTHPDIGIFLSGIDVDTFRELRDHCKERRFMAVVVDPLRQQNGVFNNEKKPNEYKSAKGEEKFSNKLIKRYNVLLDRLRYVQVQRGSSAIPCILPGPLRQMRVSNGDRDDIQLEMDRGFFRLKGKVEHNEDNLNEIKKEIMKINLKNESNYKRIETLVKENQELRSLIKKIKDKTNENSIFKNTLQNILQGFKELTR